jgi:hypothetical protein
MHDTLRVVEGFGLRPRAGRLDVLGGRRTARLSAPAASAATTLRLLDLLRAGHSTTAAAAHLGVPVAAVDAQVVPLLRIGVLTEADRPTGAPEPMVRYLERTLGCGPAAAALDRLATAVVRIDGDPAAAAVVEELLAASGTGSTSDGPLSLVIRCNSREPSDLPTLYVQVTEKEAIVGPLCNVPGGRCGHCSVPGDVPAGLAVDGVGLAVAAGEAVRFLSGTGYCRTTTGVLRIGDRGRVHSFEPVTREPDCPVCGVPGADAEAYRSLQLADVPLLADLHWSTVDDSIAYLATPGNETSKAEEPTLRAVAAVFGALPAARRSRIPAVGGAILLNAYAVGSGEDGTFCRHLDPRLRRTTPLPVAAAAAGPLTRPGRLTVVVVARRSRAEALFGPRAAIVLRQNTGFLLGALDALEPTPRDGTEVPDAFARAIGLDRDRDVVTVIVDLPLRTAALPRRRPTPATSVRGADLSAIAAVVKDSDVEMSVAGPEILGERDIRASAVLLVHSDVRTSDIVAAQCRAAERIRRAARARGLDAILLADLPSTAAAPDGRGWRTTHRSFAAVALAPSGALPDIDDGTVGHW